ncbi:MAG TPA: SusC/RagA family TonB-linked outer membrane protein [Longimicrobium sp.]|nr:SusC/RagA family TonB-linked outer membrane protein [Longimicrobium sp.]
MRPTRLRRWLGATLLLLCGALPSRAAAQEPYTITGTVLDADTRAPLANATVQLRTGAEGTAQRTVTDEAGRYTLRARVAAGTYTLQFSQLGRGTATRQVTLGAAREVTVEPVPLAAAALQLEELVVTGQGVPTERREVGNTVATVRGEEVNQAPATPSVDRALQGRIAGAVISQNSGNPGAGSTIRLRGTSSILGGADPLIVVDGIIIENNTDPLISLGSNNTRQGSAVSSRLTDIAPGDIERVEVLKGAAAAALYGSRANNGVIQIFTRRGSQGEPRVNFTTEYSSSETPRYFAINEAPRAGLGDVSFLRKPDGTAYVLGDPITRFNVQPQIFRTAPGVNSHLSISGGTGGTSYYLSGGWTDQEGIIRSTGHEKRTIRGKVTQQVSNAVEVAVNASYIQSRTQYQPEGEQTAGALTIALFTPTGFNYAFDPALGRYPYTPVITANPLQVLREVQAEANVDRLLGSVQTTLTPTDNLTVTALFGLDDSREANLFLQPPYSTGPAFTGSISNPVRSIRKSNADVTANLETPFGDAFRLTTTAGYRYTSDRINTIRAGAENLPPGQEVVGGATQFASQGITELRTVGGFLQERLAIADRLFLTGALNLEASSAFGPDERWQLFPRLGTSWVVDEMPFWDNSGVSSVLSALRLRASYGQTGGQPPAAYGIFNNFTDVIFGGRPGQAGSTVLGNPNLKPERQREWEGGFDVGLFGDRAMLEFTYYDQLTKDVVLLRPLQSSSGFDVQYQNIGEISNRGIEITAGAELLRRGGFSWNTRMTYARNRNRVEKMRTAGDTIFSEYLNIVAEGLPVGVFYGNYYPRDAQGNIILFPKTPQGAFIFDPTICPNDPARACYPGRAREGSTILRKVLGDPNPDFTASLSSTLSYNDNLQFSFLLDGRFGNEVANFTRRIQDYFGLSEATEEEIAGTVPAGYYTLNAERHLLYEAFVEDGSFIKLREVALGYTFTQPWVRGRLGAESLTLRVAGRNLHAWTDYSGIDPEVNLFGGSTVARGVDFVTTPIPRSLTVGLTVNF